MSDAAAVPDTLVEVLESQAMIFAEPAPANELPRPSGPLVVGSIRFSGPRSGALELLTSEATARDVAANMLGLDPDDPEVSTSADDALRELVNVAIGRVLTDTFGDAAVFDLTPPAFRGSVHADAWEVFQRREGAIGLSTDGDPVLVAVRWSDPDPDPDPDGDGDEGAR